MSWFEDLLYTKSKTWIYGALNPNNTPEKMLTKQVGINKEYLFVRLNSMHIVNVRKGLTTYYAAVNSNITIAHKSGNDASFNVVTSPNKLKELNANHVENVLSVNIPLLGPIPYQGGGMSIELGLFSIKSSDLTKPYLSLLSKLSAAAGVSFISTALPLANLIKDGISTVAGGDQLEIGLSTKSDPVKTGYFALIQATSNELDLNEVVLSKDYLLFDKAQKPIVDYSYLVYQVYTKPAREDWFNIPELKQAYKKLEDAIHQKTQTAIKETLMAFKVATYTSHDLIFKDAEKIYASVEAQVQKTANESKVFSNTPLASAAPHAALPALHSYAIPFR